MYYDHKTRHGSNSHLPYYLLNGLRYLYPEQILRRRLPSALRAIQERKDSEYILDRVDYYNKIVRITPLPADAIQLKDLRLKNNSSVYFFDAREYLRWFDPNLRFKYLFGDITTVPDSPSILKSRPIKGDNANSVLLNLDKLRHFTFVDDKTAFQDKADRCVFRGAITGKKHREEFVAQYFGHPKLDLGILAPTPHYPPEWTAPHKLSLVGHLQYKYILALEGNDVASNLKWIMSSNSIAVMPRPKYETWFMEGRLVPNVHYLEMKDDYSDLPERLEYCSAHPQLAEEIIWNAHAYIRQFLNPQREDLISLAVLDKYFRLTGQDR